MYTDYILENKCKDIISLEDFEIQADYCSSKIEVQQQYTRIFQPAFELFSS